MIRLPLNGLMDQKQREPATRARLGIQPSIPVTSSRNSIFFYQLLVHMLWTLSIDIIFLFETINPAKFMRRS